MNRTSQISSIILGYNARGQRLTLFWQRQENDAVVYSLRAEPRTYREAPQLIEGLTADNFRVAALAIEGDRS